MKYNRTISSQDINALGVNWKNKMDAVIDTMIATCVIANDPVKVEARMLSVMNNRQCMTIAEIVTAHNAAQKPQSISFNYGRFVVQRLLKAELIKRVGHGIYIGM